MPIPEDKNFIWGEDVLTYDGKTYFVGKYVGKFRGVDGKWMGVLQVPVEPPITFMGYLKNFNVLSEDRVTVEGAVTIRKYEGPEKIITIIPSKL